MTKTKHSPKLKLSLYPLTFDEVMMDVLQMKPEPREVKPGLNKPPKRRKASRRKRRKGND